MPRSKTPPLLDIPPSTATVTVRVIDSTTSLWLTSSLFWQPEMPGFDGLSVPIYCFLVSHGNRHVVFDLGVRRDWHNYAPRTVDLIQRTTRCQTNKNVSEILDDHAAETGVRSSDIEAVIWSHHHFDHIGDPSTFPLSTDLVVGPGVKTACWPAYPSNPDSLVLDADAAGRTVRTIDFASSPLQVGPFDAVDYFGDGSFYLLDAPGHSIGHMTALARVTASGRPHDDDCSFVFLGADACHHAGVLRPSAYLPLHGACPGEAAAAALQRIHRSENPGEPFFDVADNVIFPDHEAAMDTVRKMAELDASDDVFVVLGHDGSLKGHIPLFPEAINDWRAQGLKTQTRWLFLQDFEGAHALSD